MTIGELNPTVIIALLIISFTALVVTWKIHRFWLRELLEKNEVAKAEARKWEARHHFQLLKWQQRDEQEKEQQES